MSVALQAALDAVDLAIQPDADDSQQLVRAKVRGLLRGYDARWANAEMQIIDVEETLTAPLQNPATGRVSRSFDIAGKLDVRYLRQDRQGLIDHKTTKQEIADPNAPYWRQLVVEGQASHYSLLEWQNGRKIDETIWDVVRKPGISPKTLSKAARASVVSTGKYCGYATSRETVAALQTQDHENLELYESRVAFDCTTDRPEWYFQRRTVPRLDNELFEYARELWEHGQDILHTRRRTSEGMLPPRNSGACMLYGSACPYLGICSNYDTPDSDKWRRKEWVHPELPVLNGDGRGILTNSRVRCYQTCRRKEHYQYGLGIERQDAEEREALFFGTTWHIALEAWFRSFISQETIHEHCDESSSAIGVERHGSARQTTFAG